MLEDAPPRGSHDAQRVRLVDIEQGVMSPLHGQQPRQIGVIAVHAVDALDGDDHPPVVAAYLAEQLVDKIEVVVWKRSPRGLRQHGSLHDAVVRQFVVQNEIVRAEQMPEDRGIDTVAAGKRHGRIDAQEGGQALVQLFDNRVIAAHQPAGRGAGAETIDCRFDRRGDARLAGHAQIVEARVADQIASVDLHGCPVDALLDAEKRDLQPGRRGAGQSLGQSDAFRKLLHLIAFRRYAPIRCDFTFPRSL